MSFRVEEKLPMTKSESADFMQKIQNDGAKPLFPQRKIESIYFDTINNRCFDESEEGSIPRKKVRIRRYPNSNEIWNLETKISSIEGRFKNTKKIDSNSLENYLQKGIFDTHYGMLYPKFKVIYDRSYFILNRIRITFDENIKYIDMTANEYSINEDMRVFELKASRFEDMSKYYEKIPTPRSRFSKFANASRKLVPKKINK